jgi:hypothetical protein
MRAIKRQALMPALRTLVTKARDALIADHQLTFK